MIAIQFRAISKDVVYVGDRSLVVDDGANELRDSEPSSQSPTSMAYTVMLPAIIAALVLLGLILLLVQRRRRNNDEKEMNDGDGNLDDRDIVLAAAQIPVDHGGDYAEPPRDTSSSSKKTKNNDNYLFPASQDHMVDNGDSGNAGQEIATSMVAFCNSMELVRQSLTNGNGQEEDDGEEGSLTLASRDSLALRPQGQPVLSDDDASYEAIYPPQDSPESAPAER